MKDAQPKKTKRSARWPRIVLGVSLALNLLVAGMFFGGHMLSKQSGRGEFGSHVFGVGPYSRALSVKDRHAMRDEFDSRKPEFAAARSEMRALGQEVVAALRADPFDISLLNSVLDRQRAAQDEVRLAGQSLLVERVSAMSDAERATFADNLEEGLKPGRRHGRKY